MTSSERIGISLGVGIWDNFYAGFWLYFKTDQVVSVQRHVVRFYDVGKAENFSAHFPGTKAQVVVTQVAYAGQHGGIKSVGVGRYYYGLAPVPQSLAGAEKVDDSLAVQDFSYPIQQCRWQEGLL